MDICEPVANGKSYACPIRRRFSSPPLPTTMPESSTNQFKVIVNLIVQGHNCIEIPHRSIRLDRTNNSVSLGRASKDHAKGFIATEENGWLDSPVMSREHAEIVADFDNQVHFTSPPPAHPQ